MKTTMNALFLRVTLLALVLFLNVPFRLHAQTSKAEMSPEMREKIDLVNKQLAEAMQKGDLNQVMDLYADDATFVLPGGKALRGKKEIAGYLGNLTGVRNVKMNVVDAGGNGKILYQVCQTTYTTTVDGKESEQTRDYVMVLERQSDWGYKISVNSSN